MTTQAASWGRKVAIGGEHVLDAMMVRQAATVLFDPGSAVELRSLPSGQSIVVSGGDVEGIVAAVSDLPSGIGIYWCLNPVSIAPGTRRAARVDDVVCRRWLLIDIDPVLPVHTNSTTQEKESAFALAGSVNDFLTARGWPGAVVVDSGNGYHLLFRIDLPNDGEARALCRSVLHALGDRFDTEQAKIDRSVFNASRISKLPGTQARKGPHSPERPHRLCQFWYVPIALEAVTRDQLTELVRELSQATTETVVEAQEEPPADRAKASNKTADQLFGPHWEASEQETHAEPAPDASTGDEDARLEPPAQPATPTRAWGILYATTSAMDAIQRASRYAQKCTPAISGQKGHDRTMSVARGVIWGFALSVEDGLRVLLAHYNPQCQPPWSEKELLHKCQDVDRTADPKSRPRGYKLQQEREKEQAASAREREASQDEAAVQEVQIYTLADVMLMSLPAPRWAVPGILSEGLSILAGKPKLGKSFLALNLGITLAAGGTALGSIPVEAGDVLYLSLEDRLRRVQDRAGKILAGLGALANQRLHIAVECPRMVDGGLAVIDRWAARAAAPRLVIVDVWAKFRPLAKTNISVYDQDYEAAAALKAIGDRTGLSILILHHCKKAAAEDVVDEISGSLGLAGAADGVTILTRARSDNEATLFISGRDVEEKELALVFDPKKCIWTSQGSAEERTRSKIRLAVLGIFKSNGGAALFPSELSEIMEGSNPASVKKEVWRMWQEGILRKIGSKYAWPGPGDSPPDEEGF